MKAQKHACFLQYRSSFQSSTLIGRAVTRSQTSLGVRARFRLGFRAGYDVFRMYAVLISTNQIRALKILEPCFHVFSPFSAHLSPHCIIMVKSLFISDSDVLWLNICS